MNILAVNDRWFTVNTLAVNDTWFTVNILAVNESWFTVNILAVNESWSTVNILSVNESWFTVNYILMKVGSVENVQKSDCFIDLVTKCPPPEWLSRVQSSLFPWGFLWVGLHSGGYPAWRLALEGQHLYWLARWQYTVNMQGELEGLNCSFSFSVTTCSSVA